MTTTETCCIPPACTCVWVCDRAGHTVSARHPEADDRTSPHYAPTPSVFPLVLLLPKVYSLQALERIATREALKRCAGHTTTTLYDASGRWLHRREE